MTKKAPANVLIVGISPQIKYPNIIAKTKARYFKGVTRETSEYLYDWLSHKFEAPPKIPIKDNIIKWLRLGITHPDGMVKRLNIVIAKEKNRDICQTGSVVDSCLNVIATYESPKQKIIGKI